MGYRNTPKTASGYQNTYWDKKTSEHGHYVPETTGKRYGRDGSQAKIIQMRWVEDNRKHQSAPSSKPKPKPKPKAKPAPVKLSNRAAEANAYTDAYEKVMLSRQGDHVINNDQSVAQDFKNKYEANLTNELREKVPGSLESIAEDIKQKDAYTLDLGAGLELV